jgi:branched-chain amino acid transport system permease protein
VLIKDPRQVISLFIIIGLLIVLCVLPHISSAYIVSLFISILYFTSLATSWAIFAGPTRYISFAAAAFIGIGSYTTAFLVELLPMVFVIIIAAGIGFCLAAVVGLATLRLSGIYFVIFTFGLTELIRQLVLWFEINITKNLGRYIFSDFGRPEIYYGLLILCVLTFVSGYFLHRSRFGIALRTIGDDETVARHSGINVTWVKVVTFAATSSIMSAAGAIMAPRWTYIDPHIGFNHIVSFEIAIMALLGGITHLFGPVLGVIPLVLLLEFLSTTFPHYSLVILGLCFLLIVFLLPNGVIGVGRSVMNLFSTSGDRGPG